VFMAWEENDPLGATAPEIYEALSGARTLVCFLAPESAGDHCAMMGRSLFHQHTFNWLDDVLVSAPQKAR